MNPSTVATSLEEPLEEKPGAPMTLAAAARRFFHFPTPRLILAYLVLSAGLRLWHGGATGLDAALVGAVAVYWPLQEWLLHRYVLHLKPRRMAGLTVDLLFARKHREHHQRPWFLPDVFLPIPVLLSVMALNTAFFMLVTPEIGLALTGMGSMGAAALVYEWTHYLTHTPYKPRSRFYAQVCLSHRRHHFKNERLWYAFTLPLVDRLLGTGPDHRTVETSPTCRTLGVDPERSDGTKPPPA
jgi:hypothetical protein